MGSAQVVWRSTRTAWHLVPSIATKMVLYCTECQSVLLPCQFLYHNIDNACEKQKLGSARDANFPHFASIIDVLEANSGYSSDRHCMEIGPARF